MNIFCRLFVIAVFCLFTGIVNGMQTVFDLPDDVLGRSHQFIINGNKYVCVIVPGTIAAAKYNELTSNSSLQRFPFNETLKMLVGTSGFIYFPSDGRQPTTEEAVEWSCANADSHLNDEERLNSLITQWYMKMFGVIPFRNEEDPGPDDFIKAGYDENNNKKRIISYDFETMGTDEGYEVSYHVHHDTQQEETRRKSFIDNFMKIASTSVGRVLLYRILIEIRRKDTDGNGCEENNSSNLEVRNAARFLQVYCSEENSFSHSKILRDSSNFDLLDSNIKFESFSKINFNSKTKETTVIGKQTLSSINIVKEERSPDIALFHEICHWFHFIRDAVRFSKENNWNLQISTVKDFYYFRPNIKNASDMAWSGISKNNADTHFLCEEIRNILGIINASQLVYLNGDDLCENLYRICINTYIRFGHSNDEYVEYMPFVQKAINTINKNKTKYNILNKVKKSAKSVKKSISVI